MVVVVATLCLFILALTFFSMEVVLLEGINYFNGGSATQTTTATQPPSSIVGYVYGAILNPEGAVVYYKKAVFSIGEFKVRYVLGKIHIDEMGSAEKVKFSIYLYEENSPIYKYKVYMYVSGPGEYSKLIDLYSLNLARGNYRAVVEGVAFDQNGNAVGSAKVTLEFET